MRISRLLAIPAIILSLALTVQSVPAANAAGPVDATYSTGFRIQNLGSVSADACNYTVYDASGASVFGPIALPSVPVDGNIFVYTPNVPSFPSGKFSAMVECEQPVGIVVGFSNATSGDAYVGVSSPMTQVFIPSVYNNYYNYFTSFRVQNAGTSQTVRVEYFAPGNPTAIRTDDVAVPGSGAVDINQEGLSGLTQNVPYSAKLTAQGGQPLAVVVNIYGKAGTAVSNQLNAFPGLPAGSTSKIYTPIRIRNYFGYNSAATIQNTGSAMAEVDHTYTLAGVPVKTEHFQIPAGSSRVVLDLNDATLQARTLYGGVIQSTNGQPLIVTVNESTATTSRAVTYVGQATGGKALVAPTVVKTYYGYNSSITCQNIGTGTTAVSISYKGAVGASPVTVAPKVVAPALVSGAAFQIYPPDDAQVPGSFGGSAVITSNVSDIMCVINTDQNYGAPASQSIDKMEGYNAIIKN